MSAFIVSPETMHRVVRAFADYEGIAPEERTALGCKLYEMNRRAVLERYHAPDDPDFALPAYQYANVDATNGEMAKALDCFLYQCSEGRVPEKPLYRKLDKLATRMLASLGREHPSYTVAPWDFGA